MTMGYSRKIPNRGGWGLSLKKIPGIFRFVTLPLQISDKMRLHLWKFHIIVLHWNFRGQKPKSMAIPHDIFLITPGNSTYFVIDLSHFHILFFQYSWKFHVLYMSWLWFVVAKQILYMSWLWFVVVKQIIKQNWNFSHQSIFMTISFFFCFYF